MYKYLIIINIVFLEKKSNKALLECLLEMISDDGEKLSDEDVQEEVDTFMFAVSVFHTKLSK